MTKDQAMVIVMALLIAVSIRSLESYAVSAEQVTEEYIPVPLMGTLLVLLTMEEADVFPEEDNEDDW